MKTKQFYWSNEAQPHRDVAIQSIEAEARIEQENEWNLSMHAHCTKIRE